MKHLRQALRSTSATEFEHAMPTMVSQLGFTGRTLLVILRVHGTQERQCRNDHLQLSCLSWIIGSRCKRDVVLTALRDIVASSIMSSQRHFEVQHTSAPHLSTDEQKLLLLFDTLLRGSGRKASELPEEREELNKLVVALCILRDFGFGGQNGINLFRSRNDVELPDQPKEMFISSALIQRPQETLVVQELSPEEALLVYTIRLWLIAREYDEDSHQVTLDMHGHLGTTGIATFVDSVLQAVNDYGKCPLGAGCFCQPTLTADEARLLAAFSALHRGRTQCADEITGNWLAPGIASTLSRRSYMLNTALGKAGFELPDRSWNVPRLTELAAAERRFTLGLDTTNQTVH